jgi:hypothetical protein
MQRVFSFDSPASAVALSPSQRTNPWNPSGLLGAAKGFYYVAQAVLR